MNISDLWVFIIVVLEIDMNSFKLD